MDIKHKVKLEELKEQTDAIKKIAEDVNDVLNGIADIAERTSGYWDGIAGKRARAELKVRTDEAKDAVRLIEVYISGIAKKAFPDYDDGASDNLNRPLNTDLIV